MKAQKTYFGEEIDHIILKTKLNRTKQDNERLLFAFQSFPFFLQIMDKYKVYGDLMIETIVNHLRLFELSKGTPLFRRGEIISSMFIVCKGKINFYKPPLSIKIRPPDPKEKGYEKFKSIFKKYLIDSVDKELQYMYGDGQAIGEKEVLSGKKRLSLCEAHTNCIIGELTSTEYLSIFERTDFLEKNSIYSLLSSLPFFIKGKNSLTEKVMDGLTKRTFSKGQNLYRQGDHFDTFYIIRKGTFQVSIRSNVKFLSTIDMHCFFELYKNIYEQFSSNRVFELKNEYEEIKEYKLINFGSGEFLGNFELKLNTNRYLFTTQCLSDKSEVFEISRNVFESILTPSTKKILFDETAKEMVFFQKRIKDIRDVGRLRGKGNKYKQTILNKIHLKEAQILNSIPNQEIESKCLSPVTSINNTKIGSVKSKRHLFIYTTMNKNQKYSYNNNDYVADSTLNHNSNSFATCDSNHITQSTRLRKVIDINKTVLPTNLIIKKALKMKANEFYRPQTSQINDYKYFYRKRPETSVTQESSDNTISSRFRLFSESNKKQFPKCLEINKEFALNNNKNINALKIQQLFSYKKK